MKKRKHNIFLFRLGLILVVIALLYSLFAYLIKLSKAHDYFKIKKVIVRGEEEGLFSYLEGQNIFDIDLKKESEYILNLYPSYKKIRMIKMYPDRLYISFIEREPLAYVKLYRNFCVDSDLVLFDLPPKRRGLELPLIEGLETKIFGVEAGKRYNNQELALAISMIQAASGNRVLKEYFIEKIDLSDAYVVRCLFSSGNASPRATYRYNKRSVTFEIKLSSEDVVRKIKILAGILARMENDLGAIEYIDLRFKEPVIKFK
ncbi:MAG: hypothetical protein DRP74_04860 [Candidatus Omnitrophota bacterium]|nr:MAG: hypothetical protein DRP74_04860 [Candidatus Omnitrophota bacterium]